MKRIKMTKINLKWIALLVCVVIIGITVCGCSSKNHFVGQWTCSRVTQKTNSKGIPKTHVPLPNVPDIDQTVLYRASSVSIKNNGKIVIKLKSETEERVINGTWTYDESSPSDLVIHADNGKIIMLKYDSTDHIFMDDDQGMFIYRYSFSKK